MNYGAQNTIRYAITRIYCCQEEESFWQSEEGLITSHSTQKLCLQDILGNGVVTVDKAHRTCHQTIILACSTEIY